MKCEVVIIKEQKDGSATVELDVDQDFINLAVQELITKAIQQKLFKQYWDEKAKELIRK